MSWSAILPWDFSSRNAAPCENAACQVCTFTRLTQSSIIRCTSIRDIQCTQWQWASPVHQSHCLIGHTGRIPDLQCMHAHLQQRTSPSKSSPTWEVLKGTSMSQPSVYCVPLSGFCTTYRGLQYYLEISPVTMQLHVRMKPARYLYVLHKAYLYALHIQLSHPSSNQLKAVTKRYLYALDIDKAIDQVTQACHQCAALYQTPKARKEQSTSLPPDAVGVWFTADIIKWSRQLVLVLHECVTSFTAKTLLEDERHHTLREAIIVYLPMYSNASTSHRTYWSRPRI